MMKQEVSATVGFIKSFSDGKFDVTVLNKFDEKVPTGSVVVPKIKTTREGIPYIYCSIFY